MSKVGAVAVVGGGVGGIQAALDLADSGFKVYLIESDVSIGGVMAQLDKTFPTNDCSICILSPKLVEAARHPNIELLSFSEVKGLSGEAGNFKLKVVRKARYVDETKCTGCGLCMEKCPVKVDAEFEEGLAKRKAIYIPFPQAVPRVARIDPEHCLYLTKGKCGACKKVCPFDAVNYEDEDKELLLDVGAVIIASGFEAYDPSKLYQYHPEHPDVVTSMQFERLLNASGPTAGHVVRGSDHREPKRIGFIQCIGSRSTAEGKPYCSSVCCAYATKEAMIAVEHDPELEVYIFNIDVRVFGKSFEEFYQRAQKDYGIKYIDSRPSGVGVRDDGSLYVMYEDHESGKVKTMDLDMVVLSVGLDTNPKIYELAEALGIKLNEYGFVETKMEAPVCTSREGVYVLGAAQGPKDIPDTVAQASGAAAKAGALLAEARGTMIEVPELPPERDVSGEIPRVGVFVCHCGLNIGGVVDVPAVAEYAKTLPYVVYAKDNKYSCSSDTQELIKEAIKKYKLNRVVVAACTPRTHEPLFQNTVREAGLNPYLFEFVNIREHVSWVTRDDKEKATEKAKELVRMGVAKAVKLNPLYREKLPLNHSALVLGGGISGMTAALDLADMGFPVYLVEREGELGGNLRNITQLPDGRDPSEIYEPLIERVKSHPNITLYLNSKLVEVKGFIGNFEGKIETPEGEKIVEFGAAIVATGARELVPEGYYHYGEQENVITQLELEKRLPGINAKSVVMIQCVGARCPERTYCSRTCCMEALKNAIRIKEESPDTQVYIIYRDIRSYGFMEELYQRARELGVVFIKYDADKPPVVGKDNVSVYDRLLRSNLTLPADLIVLSVPMVAPEGAEETSLLFKVPIDVVSGFFFEAHVKLRPVDFATPGVYLCGTAQGPKNIPESLSQASAAASRAATLLSKEYIEAEGIVSCVNEDVCIGCEVCVPMCPYSAIEMREREVEVDGKKVVVKKSSINPAACTGCGTCAAACNPGAIEQRHFQNNQILAQVKAAFNFPQNGGGA
ncbi:heterodisulfide reductase [Methanosarcinales archaeon]|nr:MAG: heterodisulfide reductase [Methanosarcinales archaeon]